ncbi:MAG TPA: shikimate kinase [Acidobacteriaceae bacterium]|jgi:shikimate kinase
MSDPASFPENPSRIILTGFMGAGKTTVGALLAKRLGWAFVDSDHVVEKRAAMTVAQIFEQRGEAAFRELEAAAVREAGCEHRLILALGGGALEIPATREFLASLTEIMIVFLEAPLETMITRCARHDSGPVRPVLADQARLAERWRQRLPWYRRAHLTVQTEKLSPQAVVECIMESLKSWPDAGDRVTPSSSAQACDKRGILA